MKRFLLFGLMLLSVSRLWADPIDEEQARSLAEQFFHQQLRGTSCRLSQPLSVNGVTRAGLGASDLYIYNRTDHPGFVVVAGEDRVNPILAYSFTNSFPEEVELPENVKGWLASMERQIADARQRTDLPKMTTTNTSIGEVVCQIETALWDQGAPYCHECPVYDGYYSVTGCTATALAIVMRHHCWPEQGVGTLPAYTTDSYQISVEERSIDHTYDWDHMLMDYSQGYSDAEAMAVATLMRDCGQMLQSDYSPVGTGASLADVVPQMITYMGYDRSAQYMESNYTHPSIWLSKITAELSAGYPVLYGGINEEAGHAFVLDGYTTEDYFSVNWGWSGYYNGYFRLSALEPTGQGTGGSGEHYNLYQHAVIGLRPDQGGDYVDQLCFVPTQGTDRYFKGLSSSTYLFEDGISFTVDFGLLCNFSYEPFEGEVIIAHADQTCSIIKEALALYDLTDVPFYRGYWGKDIPVTLQQPIEEGDLLCMYYRSSDAEAWSLISGNEEQGCQWYIPLRKIDQYNLEDIISLQFDNFAHTFFILSNYFDLSRLQVELTHTDGGVDYSSFVVIVDSTCVGFDASQLPAGTYRLRLVYETLEKTLYVTF